MSVTSGPSVLTNGLVLSVDASNTEKSWKGRYMTNLFSVPTPDASGNVTFQYQGTGTFKRITTGTYGGYDIKPTDVVYRYDLGSLGCHYHGNPSPYNINAGSTATFSCDYYVDPSVTGYPETNYLANFEGQISNSVGDPTPTLIGVWKRFSFSATASAVGSFNMYLYPGACGSTRLASSGFILYKNPQVELDAPGNTPSPFVAGQRTFSQSVIDMTNNNTVDTTELTFNSDNTYSFDGVNDRLTISSFTNKPASSITCSAWIYPTRAVSTGTVRGAAVSASSSLYLGIFDSADGGATHSLHWAVQTSNGRPTSANGQIPRNAWSYIVGTYDGTTSRAYVNGVEVWSSALTGTINDGTYYIGAYGGAPADGTHNFAGKISNAQIYNRALSAAEIKNNYNALKTRFGL